MFTLRCTTKLLSRLGARDAGRDAPTSTTRLGDWFANYVIVERQHLALAVSRSTLLPVLAPAAPLRTLTQRLPLLVAEMLYELGIPTATIESELDAMRECMIARTDDRRVLGSMNDFVHLLHHVPLDQLQPAALELARAPCGPIGMESPERLTRRILGLR